MEFVFHYFAGYDVPLCPAGSAHPAFSGTATGFVRKKIAPVRTRLGGEADSQ
jgi:hypothetical protein